MNDFKKALAGKLAIHEAEWNLERDTNHSQWGNKVMDPEFVERWIGRGYGRRLISSLKDFPSRRCCEILTQKRSAVVFIRQTDAQFRLVFKRFINELDPVDTAWMVRRFGKELAEHKYDASHNRILDVKKPASSALQPAPSRG